MKKKTEAMDTPSAIELFRVATIISGLKLEVNHGMRHSTNATFFAAKAMTGKKTRKSALTAMLLIQAELRAVKQLKHSLTYPADDLG